MADDDEPSAFGYAKAQARDLYDTARYAVGAIDRSQYRPMGHFDDALKRKKKVEEEQGHQRPTTRLKDIN